MTINPTLTKTRGILRQSSLGLVAVVYLVAVLVLRWGYPVSPRLVISAGPKALFGGFTPDGNKILTNDQPGWRLCDVRTGRIGPYIWAQRAQDPVGFTPDGQRMYAGSDYFSLETGEKLPGKRYIGPGWNLGVNSVDTDSPDGLTIAHTGFEKTLVGDANTGEERFQVPGGCAAVFSPDGKTVLVAVNRQVGPDFSRTGPLQWGITVFDATNGQEQSTIAEDEGFVQGMALSPDGTKVALAIWTEKGQASPMGIQIWDVRAGQRVKTLPMLRDEQIRNVGRMQFLADGRVLAVTGGNFLGLGSFAWDLTVPIPEDLATKPDYLIGQIDFAFPFTVLSADGHLAAIWDGRSKELQVRRLGNEKTEIISRRRYPKNVDCWPQSFTSEERLIVHVNHAVGGDRAAMGVMGKIADTISRWWGGHTEYEIIDPLSGRLLGKTPTFNQAPTAGISPDGRTLVTHEMKLKLRDRFTLWDIPTHTPWLAILVWPLLPAAALGMFLRSRARSRDVKVSGAE